MNTLLTYNQQLDLVDRRLAVKKTDGIYDTFKYHRRVMYDYLWDSEPNAWECRGHVYDNTNGQLIAAAPRKSFNYLENNWWSDVALDTKVVAYKKFNGYMACLSIHNGKYVVSTTGSTASEYATWARELMQNEFKVTVQDYTTLYEVIVEQDPHIVKEKLGLHCLGWRSKNSGLFIPHGEAIYGTLQDIIFLSKKDRGEGFMVYLPDGRNCKIKSTYYVDKKKLMRMSKSGIEKMFAVPNITMQNFSLLFQSVIKYIIQEYDVQSWVNTPEQDRRSIIENLIGD